MTYPKIFFFQKKDHFRLSLIDHEKNTIWQKDEFLKTGQHFSGLIGYDITCRKI